MPVTHLVWYPSTSASITDEGKAALGQMGSALEAWAPPSAAGGQQQGDGEGEGEEEEFRAGAYVRRRATFQQLEDPAVCLSAGTWASPAQHAAFSASLAAPLLAAAAAHFDLARATGFHVRGGGGGGVGLLDAEGEEGGEEASLLRSPVVSLGRLTVRTTAAAVAAEAGEQEEGGKEGGGGFAAAWEREALPALRAFAAPRDVRCGWMVEGEGEDGQRGEGVFVFLAGWPSVERHMEFAQSDGFARYAAAIAPFIVDREVKHYRRIL